MLSFKKLIEREYKEILENDLEKLLLNHQREFIAAYYPYSRFEVLDFMGLDIMRISIEDTGIDEVEVTIQIKMYWTLKMKDSDSIEDRTPWANLNGTFYLSEEGYQLGDLTVSRYERLSSQKSLDDQLVPVIFPHQLDDVATNILREYYPEVLNDKVPLDPHVLAERMGLTIEAYPLDQDCHIRGKIYFRDGYLEYTDEESQNLIDRPIRKGTIIINQLLKENYGEGAYNNTIVHECVHWELHYKAALFAQMIFSNFQSTSMTEELELDDEDWMEKQAIWLAPCILMPKARCLEVIEKAKEEYQHFSELFKNMLINDPETDHLSEMAWGLLAVKEHFKVSIESAKYRMKYLGYEEVEGIFNYVNGQYTSYFKYSPGSLLKNQSFIIHRDHFTQLLQSSPSFLAKLKQGNYIFLNAVVIKNEPKYLEVDEEGQVHLTPYALHHMDECCLKFDVKSIKRRSIPKTFNQFPFLYHLAHHPLNFMISESGTDDTVSYIQEAQNDVYEVIKALPNNFPEAVTYLIKYYGYTLEKVAEKTELSVEKIRDMRKDEDKNHSMKVVMKFCVGMGLPFHISWQLIHLSGNTFKSSKRDTVYQTLLVAHNNLGVDQANQWLMSQGVAPL